MLVEVEGMEGTAEAGLDAPQNGVDPSELRQVVGVLPIGDHGLTLLPISLRSGRPGAVE